MPHDPIALLALWKLGAITVPLNPTYKKAELRRLIDDSGTIGVTASYAALDETRETLVGSAVRFVLDSDDRAHQTRNDKRVFGRVPDAPARSGRPCAPGDDVDALFEGSTGAARRQPADLGEADVAFGTSTSGATWPPKGATNSRLNYLHSVANYSRWVGLAPGDVVPRERPDVPHHRSGPERRGWPC